MRIFDLYIDGEFCAGSDGQIMDSINPATNEAWAQFHCASSDDVERAVVSAKKALNNSTWCTLSATERGKLLYKLADLIEENATLLGDLETTDSGKLAKETRAQTAYVADYYRYYAGLADKLEGSTLPIDKKDLFVYTVNKPIGIVAAIVPWNAQMFLAATKIGPALAAGCCVILKASETAPATMLEFARLFNEAGFEKGVIQVITGDAKNCAIPLTSHPDIDRIAFTGGTEAARHVVKNSSENFAVTSLELGGKSPIIIFEDADIEGAVNGLVAGNFGASGQSCVAGSRVIVHRSIKDRVIKLLKERVHDIVIGDPLDMTSHMGPLCTKAQIDNIEKTLKKSLDQGATIHFGGNQPPNKKGFYFAPTLIECPHSDIASLKVEFFGPIMSLISFDDEEEAVALANDTEFGLGSGVFTQDLGRAHRVSHAIRSGICWVNTYRAISPIAPFGGFNQSGYGREAGIEAIRDYCRTQTVWINTGTSPMEDPFTMR